MAVVLLGATIKQHLWLGIIKTPGMPCRMYPLFPRVEILKQCSVKTAKALGFIDNGMGMYEVNNHCQPRRVGAVDERFQLIGCAIPE